MPKKYKIMIIVLISVTLFITACSNSGTNADAETDYIKFFYYDNSNHNWSVEKKMLPADAELIVNELIKSKNNLIPKDTKLLSFEVKDNIAYVNLSKDFEDITTLGDNGIWKNIYTIVNTLCLNESLHIDSVKFMLDGKEEQYIGSTITSEPIKPNID